MKTYKDFEKRFIGASDSAFLTLTGADGTKTELKFGEFGCIIRLTRIPKAVEIAARIRQSSTWDGDTCRELCDLAGLADEWDAADGETFEAVVYKAANILGVEI